jgi:hypothetical protein
VRQVKSHQTSKEVLALRARLKWVHATASSVETANVENFFIIEIEGQILSWRVWSEGVLRLWLRSWKGKMIGAYQWWIEKSRRCCGEDAVGLVYKCSSKFFELVCCSPSRSNFASRRELRSSVVFREQQRTWRWRRVTFFLASAEKGCFASETRFCVSASGAHHLVCEITTFTE